MRGLLRKEFLALKGFYIISAVLGLFCIFTSFIHKETNQAMIWVFSTMVMPVAAALVQSRDSENGWKSFEAVLPLSKAQIVSSKFIVALMGVLPSVIVIAASMIIQKYFFAIDEVFDMSEIYCALITMFLAIIASVFSILVIHLFGKFGEIIGMFFIGMTNSMFILEDLNGEILIFALLVAIISAVVLFPLCWILSVWVYKRKGIK